MRKNLLLILLAISAMAWMPKSALADNEIVQLYDVTLVSTNNHDATVAKILKEKLSITLSEALDIINSLPAVILECAESAEALALKDALETAGATVTVAQSSTALPNSYDVKLISYTNKMDMIKMLMDKLDIGLTDANTLVSSVPAIVLSDVDYETAQTFLQYIIDAGGTGEIVEHLKTNGIVISIDSDNFPDEQLRTFVLENFDQNNDNFLVRAEIESVRGIDIYDLRAESFKGLEKFYKIKKLDCHYNIYPQELDVTNFPDLEYLDCSVNKITSLDLQYLPKLKYLNCAANNLTGELYLANNTELTYLNCQQNELTEVTVWACTNLETLNCYSNMVLTLDLSQNKNLDDLWCEENQLKTLNVSQNEKLTSLICENNQISSIDVSHNPLLEYLVVSDNELTSLDLSNNPKLETLRCDNNTLSTLDISHLQYLSKLTCDNCGLTSLALQNKPEITMLSVSDNNLRSIDVTGMPHLQYLDCNNCGLTSLNVQNNTELIDLECARNALTGIQMTTVPQLMQLNLSRNQIKKDAMSAIINKLPVVEKEWVEIGFDPFGDDEEEGFWVYNANLIVIDNREGTEGNVCTKSQVQRANNKGWDCLEVIGDGFPPSYKGSEEIIPTLVDAVSANTTTDAPRYNLQGQRVGDSYKGVVIQKNRKIVR